MIQKSNLIVEGTDVILDKVFVREKDLVVTLLLESKINSIEGKFLSPYEFSTDDKGTTNTVSRDVEIKVYTETGQELMVGGGIKENEVGFIIDKEGFKKSKELKVLING